jgi:hypothetical protein
VGRQVTTTSTAAASARGWRRRAPAARRISARAAVRFHRPAAPPRDARPSATRWREAEKPTAVTSGRRGLGGAAALAQLAIQHQQSGAVLADHPELLCQQAAGLLLLHLLLDEPVEEDPAGEVALVHGETVDRVDAGRHLLLVPVGLLEDLPGRGEVGGRPVDLAQGHLAAPVEEMVEDPERVLVLLGCLRPHPAGEAGEVHPVAVRRH